MNKPKFEVFWNNPQDFDGHQTWAVQMTYHDEDYDTQTLVILDCYWDQDEAVDAVEELTKAVETLAQTLFHQEELRTDDFIPINFSWR